MITKVIFDGQIDKALSRSISEEHFADDECRRMWRYIVNHTRKYKIAPSQAAIEHDHQDFEWMIVQDSLDYLLDRFQVLVTRRLADDMLLEVAQAADDPERNENMDMEFLLAAQRVVSAIPTGQVERFSQIDKRIRDYEERQAKGRLRGIPYGFPTLDRKTGGVFPHELVAVLGFTNVGKSTFLRVSAYKMLLKMYRVLYFSLEMGADEILAAFDAMAANLDYSSLTQLDLSAGHMDSWREFAKRHEGHKGDIEIIDSLYRVTPDQVYAQTLRHKPDIVFVDYVGLMRSSFAARGVKRYQQITDITEELKITARMLKVPIIMAAQTNREGAKYGAELDNVADAISIVQNSDTVIGLHQDEDMEAAKELEIRINKSRKGPRGKFIATWNHEKQIFRERTVSDRMSRNGDMPEPGHSPVTRGERMWVKNEFSPFAHR